MSQRGPVSKETREKMRQAKLRNPTRHWLGKKRGETSPEVKAKISASLSGVPKPEGFGDHLRELLTGVPRTPEIVDNMKAAMNRPEVRAAISRGLKGKKYSPARCAQMSAAAMGKPAQYPRKWCYHRDQAFRSTWEARVAKALDLLAIKWEYECKRFDLVTQTYAPDFYLPDQGVYWEVKGYYGPKSQKTVGLFRQCYPDIPLVVIDEVGMLAVERAAEARSREVTASTELVNS